ncbi:MAG TPA: molybdopterin-dependent oxidoreductase [Actinomycetes bacterium]
MKRAAYAVIGVAVLAAALAGCGSSTPNSPAGAPATTTKPVTSTRPAAVPKPVGKTVLRMEGALNRHNVGTSLAFDQKTLDAMATSTATLFEPFVKRDIRFTGIPMSDLLTRAGVAPTAKTVHMHALDDYKVEFKVSDLMAPGVLLATKADGAAIPIGKGGPIRLVFPPDSAAGKNKDVWIWSIDSMTIG